MTIVKTPRNRSLNFADHTGLIHKLAKKYHARLLAAQIMGVNFDDVFGELSIAFVKASRGYNPDSEWSFTAYLSQSLQNNFNKFARRLILEQYGSEEPSDLDGCAIGKTGLGYISVEELNKSTEFGSMGFLDICESNVFASPEDAVDAAMTLKGIVNDDTLSAETRVYISMIAQGTNVSDSVKKSIRRKTAVIRSEISARYGVQMGTICV